MLSLPLSVFIQGEAGVGVTAVFVAAIGVAVIGVAVIGASVNGGTGACIGGGADGAVEASSRSGSMRTSFFQSLDTHFRDEKKGGVDTDAPLLSAK